MPYQPSNNGIHHAEQTATLGNQLLRSEEVNEIISHKPGFLIRWGITIFFLILLLIVAATFFIHYPDTVFANARLTSINAPKEVKTKVSGKLMKLSITEDDYVSQNAVLGFMESTANHEAMIKFSKAVDSVRMLLVQNRTEEGIRYFNALSFQSPPFPPPSGEIEGAVSTFIPQFILFKQYLSAGFYIKKKNMLQSDLTYLQRLHSTLTEQKEMQQEDLGLVKETFDANSKLKDEKVISAFDYRSEKSKYINKALTIPQINGAIISNESSQHEKQKEILQLENEIAQQKGIFMQALNSLKSQIDDWKIKYLLIAPVDGKIAFAGFFQENQQVQANQTICFVNPGNSSYYAEIYVPQNNFGKIKRGEKVLLKLPSYPFEEYGAIEGRLDFISNIATDSGYAAKVIFNNGLKTNNNKQVQYRDGLIARGEIITDDLKLSDRLINSVKQFFKK